MPCNVSETGLRAKSEELRGNGNAGRAKSGEPEDQRLKVESERKKGQEAHIARNVDPFWVFPHWELKG